MLSGKASLSPRHLLVGVDGLGKFALLHQHPAAGEVGQLHHLLLLGVLGLALGNLDEAGQRGVVVAPLHLAHPEEVEGLQAVVAVRLRCQLLEDFRRLGHPLLAGDVRPLEEPLAVDVGQLRRQLTVRPPGPLDVGLDVGEVVEPAGGVEVLRQRLPVARGVQGEQLAQVDARRAPVPLLVERVTEVVQRVRVLGVLLERLVPHQVVEEDGGGGPVAEEVLNLPVTEAAQERLLARGLGLPHVLRLHHLEVVLGVFRLGRHLLELRRQLDGGRGLGRRRAGKQPWQDSHPRPSEHYFCPVCPAGAAGFVPSACCADLTPASFVISTS